MKDTIKSDMAAAKLLDKQKPYAANDKVFIADYQTKEEPTVLAATEIDGKATHVVGRRGVSNNL